MTYETFLDAIPDYAQDLKLNLTSLLKQAELSEQQTWGTVIASAISAPQTTLTAILLTRRSRNQTGRKPESWSLL